MTWLYLPSEALKRAPTDQVFSDFPSALAPGDSTSASTLPSHDIKLWVMSSGTPMLRPLSWRGWQTRVWVKHLSGTTLALSMAKRGVAQWISSMVAIRASRSVSQDGSSATKTHAISGRTLLALLTRSNHRFAFSRMSADIYDWGSNKSTMTFDQWVTALRQACLQRKKLVLRTSGKDFSFWPTATATDSRVTHARPPEKMIRKDGRNVLRTPSLAETVMQPKDFPYTKQDLDLALHNLDYRTAKIHWPTPRAREPGSTSSSHGISLNEASKTWPTPRTCSGKRSSGANRTEIINSWATPMARDWKDGVLISNKTKTRSNLSRQAPRTNLGGSATSNAPRTLNPLFVEALMGWPIGWTDCGSAVTGLSRWQQLMHSTFSRLKLNLIPEQPCLI